MTVSGTLSSFRRCQVNFLPQVPVIRSLRPIGHRIWRNRSQCSPRDRCWILQPLAHLPPSILTNPNNAVARSPMSWSTIQPSWNYNNRISIVYYPVLNRRHPRPSLPNSKSCRPRRLESTRLTMTITSPQLVWSLAMSIGISTHHSRMSPRRCLKNFSPIDRRQIINELCSTNGSELSWKLFKTSINKWKN